MPEEPGDSTDVSDPGEEEILGYNRRKVLAGAGAAGVGGLTAAAALLNRRNQPDSPPPANDSAGEGDANDPSTGSPTGNDSTTGSPTGNDSTTGSPPENDSSTDSPDPVEFATDEVIYVGESEGDLARYRVGEDIFVVEDEGDLPDLDGTDICYPESGSVVATYDAGVIESNDLLSGVVEDIEPHKGTYGLDLDVVDASVVSRDGSEEGYDEEPEFMAQLVGSKGRDYLTDDQMEELTSISYNEIIEC